MTGIEGPSGIPGAGPGLTDILGLTSATQTLCVKPVENVSLASGAFLQNNSGSTNVINLSGNGPGVLTQFTVILFSTTANFNSARALLFTFTVDGTQTIQFDADLWGVSQLPSPSGIPDLTSPFVFENDHLILMCAKDSINDVEIQLTFKFPIPFANSLTLTVQNQAYAAAAWNGVWLHHSAQMGVSSPRRLQCQFTNCNTPLQIPSAVEWQSGYTANGGYLVGGLATNGGALYQCISAISGGTTAPPSDATHWSAVSIASNPNFNTGYTLLSVAQPCWLVFVAINGQGPVNGGTYGSANVNIISFLESNFACYDGNLNPGPSFAGASPTTGLIFNSSGSEDFMVQSFYGVTLGDLASKVTVPTTVSTTPFNVLSSGKNKQLRHGYNVSVQSAFMGMNVDLMSIHSGGIKCSQSCLLRWEEGNYARANSGPITPNNTWKINPTILYYI